MDTPVGFLVEEDLDPCIRWWITVLNLEHWRVEHFLTNAESMKMEKALMYIVPTRARLHASIYIRAGILQRLSGIGVQKLLVHELTHLIYDPLAEEHQCQLKYQSDQCRVEESDARFTQVLEKSVEHTAQMLCKITQWTK